MIDGFASALAAEFDKLRTLRSGIAALLITLFGSLALGLASGFSVRSAIDNRSTLLEPDFTAEAAGFDAIFYGEVALVVFAVLAVTHEFGSRMIMQSWIAVPNRLTWYTAKVVATATAALVVAVPTVVLTYLATQWGLGPHGSTLSAPTVWRAVAGGVGFLVLVALLCVGFSAAVRSPIVAMSVLLPLFFVVSPLLHALQPTRRIADYLPDRMGMAMVATGTAGDGVSPGQGSLVMLAWALAAVVAGALVIRRLEV